MILRDAVIGEKYIITKINNASDVKKRLYSIGIVEGVRVAVIRKAPLGDPIELKIRDFYLAIRSVDAMKIEVERYGKSSSFNR